MVLASSVQPQRWWERENKENKQRAAHFLACFLVLSPRPPLRKKEKKTPDRRLG